MAAEETKNVNYLGLEASIRYAQNEQLYDPKYIEDAKIVPSYTEEVSSSPWQLPEFLDTYPVGPKKESARAIFPEIPSHLRPDKTVFREQLIDSLGSSEKFESDYEKLEKIREILEKDPKKDLQTKKDQADLEKLQKGFDQIRFLNKILARINAERNRIHRG